MTAPQASYVESTTSLADVTMPASASLTTPQVGDLCVINMYGSTGNTPATGTPVTYLDNAADAGYSDDHTVTNSGNVRIRRVSKVLTSADFSGANFRQVASAQSGTGTGRLIICIVPPPSGYVWDANRVLATIDQTANVANDSTIATLTDAAAPIFLMISWATAGTGQNSLTWAYDGGAARAPYCDESTSTDTDGVIGHHYGGGAAANVLQSDINYYDVGDTPSAIVQNVGTPNNVHAIAVTEYQATKAPIAVGTVTFTDTAQTITPKKTITLGTVIFTDEPQPITQPGILGIVTFTDEIQPITVTRPIALGTVTFTDEPQTITFTKTKALGIVTFVDTPQIIGPAFVSSIPFNLDDPGTGPWASITLGAWAFKENPGDAGDIRLSLYQDTTLITEGDWEALTDTATEYTLPIVGTITDYSVLVALVQVRTTTTVSADVSQVALELVGGVALGTVTFSDAPQAITFTKTVAVGTIIFVDMPRPIAGGQQRASSRMLVFFT